MCFHGYYVECTRRLMLYSLNSLVALIIFFDYIFLLDEVLE
jgi:hypothetical protein